MKPKKRLLNYLQNRPNQHFIKGDLLRIAQEKLQAEGITMYDETLGRYLRELAEDPECNVESYTNKKGFAIYYYKPNKYEQHHAQMQMI